jgi:hypothetical protein
VHPRALRHVKATIMKHPFLLVLFAATLWCPSTARGAIIQLLPGNQNVVPGSSASIDVVISGLGGSVVGDFDLDISFDASVLTLDSFTLGAALGDASAGDALDFSLGVVGPGLLNAAEVSLLSTAALTLLQVEPFTLAQLRFHIGALASGATTLVEVAIVNALGDGAAVAIPVNSLTGATLTGTGPGVVAEPAASLLVLTALYAIERRRLKSRRPPAGGV